jgi:DNA repair protein RecN (Recombination protein N)
MLTRLIIHDVVLINKLALELEPGLNVFTGETGAGKSILLDALGLALGERSDAALVRPDAEQASVTAEFVSTAGHPVFTLADEQGLSVTNPVILRRVIGKDGKSRAFVNDQPIGIGVLKQFGERLLEIHGQFETHGLLDATTHRGLLDAFAGLGMLKQTTAAAYALWGCAQEKLCFATDERDRARAEEEFLRAAVAELEELAPEAGEADHLSERRIALQHREKILNALHTAEQALNGEGGALATLALAGKAIARIAEKAMDLRELLASIDRSATELDEVSQQLDRQLRTLTAEPDALQCIEDRLFALRALARKHHVSVDQLADLTKSLTARLALLTDQGDQLAALARAASDAKKSYITYAEELSANRKQSGAQLEKAVMKELPPLKLERAQFKIEITVLPDHQWNADGMDRIAFLATTNPGASPGSIQKIASGGELARFMLALKVVLAASDPVPTLVFDEVDSGIGGATASAVGERLARLANDVQILVVTHSPQVAARATNHLRVLKQIQATQAIIEVETLDEDERREEIARMLAGTRVTDAARHAATSLLKDATLPKKPSKRARA